MKNIFFLLILFLFLSACKETTKKGDENSGKKMTTSSSEGGRTIIDAGSTSQYTGQPGRLMIVADNTVYTDDIQELIESFFYAPIRPYYPFTPYFEIYQRNEKDFQRLSTKLRNVLDLKIDDAIEKGKPTMHIYKNYYARTQLYTKLRAHDMQDLYKLLLNEIDYLFQIYDAQEWKREFYRHSKNKNEVTRAKIQEKFGIDLVLPDKFNYESIDDTYAIIIFPDRVKQMELKTTSGTAASRSNTIQSGVMIWQYPYTDTSQLSEASLLQMRDTILKKYAKHELEGVYMGTQYHPAVIPQFKNFQIGGIVGKEVRGLYKFTGRLEPSGGKFWGFHFKHPKEDKIVVVSGYIGAPPTETARLELNKIRAVIYSLQLAEE